MIADMPFPLVDLVYKRRGELRTSSRAGAPCDVMVTCCSRHDDVASFSDISSQSWLVADDQRSSRYVAEWAMRNALTTERIVALIHEQQKLVQQKFCDATLYTVFFLQNFVHEVFIDWRCVVAFDRD